MQVAQRLRRRWAGRAVGLALAGLGLFVPGHVARAGSSSEQPDAFSYRRLWARTRFSLSIAAALDDDPSLARQDARERVLFDALATFVDELPMSVPAGPLDERRGLFEALDELVAELVDAFGEARLAEWPRLAALSSRALTLTDGLASDTVPLELRPKLARARAEWRLRQRWTVPAADLATTTRQIDECAQILASEAGRAAFADGGTKVHRQLGAWVDATLASPGWALAPSAATATAAAERTSLRCEQLERLFGGGPTAAGIEALVDRLRDDLRLLVAAPLGVAGEPPVAAPDTRAFALRFLEARALVRTLAENLDRVAPAPLSRERFVEICDVFETFPQLTLTTADRTEWTAVAPESWQRRISAAGQARIDVASVVPDQVRARLLDTEGRTYSLEPLIVEPPASWPTIPGVDLLLQLGPSESGVPIAVHAAAIQNTFELPPELPLGVVVFIGPPAEDSSTRELAVLEAAAWSRAQLVSRVMDMTRGNYITPTRPDARTPQPETLWEPVYRFLVEFLGDPQNVDLRTQAGREQALRELTRPQETAVLVGRTATQLIELLAEFRATQLPSSAVCEWMEPWAARALGWDQLHTEVRHLRSDEAVDPNRSYILREAYHLVLP